MEGMYERELNIIPRQPTVNTVPLRDTWAFLQTIQEAIPLSVSARLQLLHPLDRLEGGLCL